MRSKLLLFIILHPIIGYGQIIKSFKKEKTGIRITLNEGNLWIYPLSENSVRVKFYKETKDSLPEIVFTSKTAIIPFQINETNSKVELKTGKMSVLVDKRSGRLSFADASGKVFLNELAGTRKLTPQLAQGQKCFIAEQQFDSPVNEYIFGLGQFQDGHYNLRGVSRRLTQVNTQISIPFIYSSRGFGLFWHQYGLTDFNPTDNFIDLKKQKQDSTAHQMAEVTTTSGTRKILQEQSLYQGKFDVPRDAEYSIFLNLGTMGNCHFVEIDGKPVIDQANVWLPPTVGTLIKLTKGEHFVKVVCKADNVPELSWSLKKNTTTFRSPDAKSLDYVVFAGSADDVIASYRNLSGNVPLLPEAGYGFWQCRERYTSAAQLVETIDEFRKRKLPVDFIVQDWQYWGDNGWGVPQFDDKYYPNPKDFISKLHDLHARLSVSVWSNPDKNSEIGKELAAKKLFIPNTKWLDYFNPETRKEYWHVINENLFSKGVDAWWLDAVEPENDALKGEKTFLGAGDFYRLTYPYFVSKTFYEGQRAATNDKRVCILTRSAFPGQQRFGIINWSGDIGATWDVFRRQIVAGLNYSITGFPYWTTDIGGFFRPVKTQYTDEHYHELLIRWFQWGAFNPIFRIHGYMSQTEPWKYGDSVESNMREMLNLRYKLIPYIYSEAWQITRNGSTIMRPLVMDFRNDTLALQHQLEYMFGKSFLVAPVTESDAREWKVYLPVKASWYDFWTGKSFKGGQSVKVPSPLNRIPLFVKAGSIIPIGRSIQYVGQKTADSLEIRIYSGANGRFDLYEDEGDGYSYERGNYRLIPFRWDQHNRTLTIGALKGALRSGLKKRIFNVILVNETAGLGMQESKVETMVIYNGKSIKVPIKY